MKKLLLFIAVAGLFLGSCGNKTQQNTDGLDSAEQVILDDSIVAQLDSMAAVLSDIIDTTDVASIFSENSIKLSDDQLKVKPDYLITENDIKDLQTLQQKYVAMAYLSLDNSVQELYHSEDDDFYGNAIARLSAETEALNEDAAKNAENAPLTLSNAKKFYADMKSRNRLDKFYIAEAAYAVEAMYIISRNVDIFMPAINDTKAESLCRQLATAINGVKLIAANHPDMQPVLEALAPVETIKVTTAAELKEQIVKANATLSTARKKLLEA